MNNTHSEIMKLALAAKGVIIEESSDGTRITLKKSAFTPIFGSTGNLTELQHITGTNSHDVYKFIYMNATPQVEHFINDKKISMISYDANCILCRMSEYDGDGNTISLNEYNELYSSSVIRKNHPGTCTTRSITINVDGVPKKYCTFDTDGKTHGSVKFQLGKKCLVIEYEHGKYVGAAVTDETLTVP